MNTKRDRTHLLVELMNLDKALDILEKSYSIMMVALDTLLFS